MAALDVAGKNVARLPQIWVGFFFRLRGPQIWGYVRIKCEYWWLNQQAIYFRVLFYTTLGHHIDIFQVFHCASQKEVPRFMLDRNNIQAHDKGNDPSTNLHLN